MKTDVKVPKSPQFPRLNTFNQLKAATKSNPSNPNSTSTILYFYSRISRYKKVLRGYTSNMSIPKSSIKLDTILSNKNS